MTAKMGLLTAAAAIALAGTCSAQTGITLYLVKSENLSQLSSAQTSPGVPTPDNSLWIGDTPTAIAYGQGALFVAGTLTGTSLPLDGADADGDSDTSESSPFNVAIVRISSILTARSFIAIPASRYSVPAGGLGFTGLDYAPNQGEAVRGLVASYDTGGGGPNQLSRYNADAAGSPLAAPVPSLFTGFRIGSCGPAWDFGPTGLGVDYAPSGALDSIPDGPAIAVSQLNSFGPYGADPGTLNTGLGSTLYEIGLNAGPRLAPDAEGHRQWRDLSIDRRNGGIAARADNTLLYCTRNPNGSATRVDLSPADPNTERFVTAIGSSISNQHVSIMTGFAPSGVGDLLVWNDRPSVAPGQPFNASIRFNKTDRPNPADSGAVVTASYLNPDGSAASLAPGTGLYDFAWDETTKILFICDGANRMVYLLSAEQPRSCCLPTGACVLLNPSACAAPEVGGLTGAVGSSCSPNPCPAATGACCNGSVCVITTPTACPGAFRGASTTCDFAGNPITCCRANFNQSGGLSVQDIFDFLAAYFGNNPAADINGAGGVTVQDVFEYLSLYFAGCSG